MTMLSSSSFKLLSNGTTLAQELPGIEPPLLGRLEPGRKRWRRNRSNNA